MGGVYTNLQALRNFGTLGKRFFANLKVTSGYREGELLAFLNAASEHQSRLDSTPLTLTSAMLVLRVCGIKAMHQNANWTPQGGRRYLLLLPTDWKHI